MQSRIQITILIGNYGNALAECGEGGKGVQGNRGPSQSIFVLHFQAVP